MRRRLVVVAAALRFPTLGDQSFWRDEASTAIELHRSFGGAMRYLADNEGMPPGYFALAWLWSQGFGLGEAGLRSLSALFGVATVPAATVSSQTATAGRGCGPGRARVTAASAAAPRLHPMRPANAQP